MSPTSTIARESDVAAPTLAGPEIGVASTKAFTCQLAVLACLALGARPRARRADRGARKKALVAELIAVPGLMAQALKHEPRIEPLAARSRAGPRRALSRPRHLLSAGAGRRAEAQGNLLYPRRGLCGRRAQARPDRADRLRHAGDRARAARPSVREDRLQHAGSRGARRPSDL